MSTKSVNHRTIFLTKYGSGEREEKDQVTRGGGGGQKRTDDMDLLQIRGGGMKRELKSVY